jgi:hypothetical protein
MTRSNRQRNNSRRVGRQQAQPTQIPAAVRGINARAALAAMAPDECVFSFNIQGKDFGMDVRKGYREWANGWTGGVAKTVISFEGNQGADDKLFIANQEGIWEVTIDGTTAPAQVVTWPSSAGDAGICHYVTFSNDGDERYIILCDEENGYYRWEQATNTWTKVTQGAGAGQVDGIDPATFAYVMIFKNRLWFIQKDTGTAWYLPVQAFAGTANLFNFASEFRSGGALALMHNWTLDGGDGIDDYLVSVSTAGDLVIYRGTDPTQASTFALVGSWMIGEVPAGRRFATAFANDFYVLSIYGLLPLSKLIQGAGVADPDLYVTNKVAPYLRPVLERSLYEYGWQVVVHARENLMHINTPPVINQAPLAFTFGFGNASWSLTRGLNKSHTVEWQGEVFWSDLSLSKLYLEGGSVDKVFIDPATDGDPQAIEWDMLTAYSALGSPGRFKRCQYIRPMFVSNVSPAVEVAARYDYDISELTGAPVLAGDGTGVWDAGIWDVSTWSGGVGSSDKVSGGQGVGRHIAVAIRGRSAEPTTLMAFDITWDTGGIM